MEIINSEKPEESVESSADEEEFPFQEPKIENYTIEELERTLAHLIEIEDYEQAAKVNEVLNEKRKKIDNNE